MRYLLMMMVVLGLAACSGREETALPDDSDVLCRGLLGVTRAYADSIAAAPDSAAAERLYVRACHLLDSVNFSVAPDTDLLLTEAENDTLCREITALRTLYENRLAVFGVPPMESADDVIYDQ